MRWQRTTTAGTLPDDAVADAVGEALAELVGGVLVEIAYRPAGEPATDLPEPNAAVARADGPGPEGWDLSVVVRLTERRAAVVQDREGAALAELVAHLPAAGTRALSRFRPGTGWQADRVTPALRRAVRDVVATELLTGYLESRTGATGQESLVAETIDYLIELSGTRVEAHDLTHGVVVADVFRDTPRLEFRYPRDVRTAKRAPLLFDGQRSVLVVDPKGHARSELQRHRLEKLAPDHIDRSDADESVASGSLVADATRIVGGLGFFVRADRSIWTFVDGQPLLVRRSEHWTAFPIELSAAIADMIGGGHGAALAARTAFVISAQPRGAILAIVDDPSDVDEIVPLKDRYDLRNEVDLAAMRTETRLHHLIDVRTLDEHTLARLATLDGATIIDRDGHLIAYGAIVTTADSEHEGARTAAARTLSETADVVLKVSVDGDITIFRDGRAVTTLLGLPSQR